MSASPHIVGYQCAGVVAEVGADVTDRTIGQRVVASYLDGSHASRRAVPSLVTWLVPDGLDIGEAACVPIAFGTADDCLFEFGHLQAGETVLVQAGASGVGLAAIQLAKRAGATVLATASSDAKLERLADFGLDHGINYQTADFAAIARDLTGGTGVDLVVDSVGSTLAGSVGALAYRGRCCLVGQAGRDPRPFDAAMLMHGNQTLTGVFFGAEIITERVQAMVAPPPGRCGRGRARRRDRPNVPVGGGCGGPRVPGESSGLRSRRPHPVVETRSSRCRGLALVCGRRDRRHEVRRVLRRALRVPASRRGPRRGAAPCRGGGRGSGSGRRLPRRRLRVWGGPQLGRRAADRRGGASRARARRDNRHGAQRPGR